MWGNGERTHKSDCCCDISDLNSVGSSSCKSIRLRGMPSSSFQNGSQKDKLSVMVPSSLLRAADSSIACALWKKRVRGEGLASEIVKMRYLKGQGASLR